MEQQRIYFTVRGTMPLLMHNAAMMMKNGGGVPKPEEEAEAACYRLPNGDLCMPASAVRKAMLTACSGQKFTEEGTNRRRSAIPLVSASVLLVDEWFPLLNEEGEPITDYAIDIRSAVVQRARILRARPRVEPAWYLRCVFGYQPRVTQETLEQVLNDAGRTVGIGDFRIEKKGPFGGFEVISTELV